MPRAEVGVVSGWKAVFCCRDMSAAADCMPRPSCGYTNGLLICLEALAAICACACAASSLALLCLAAESRAASIRARSLSSR